MLDEHIIGRAAIYPKFVAGETQIFDEEQLFELSHVKNEEGKDTGVYALSLASQILARGEGGVHDYGKRSASRQNDAFRLRKGRDPDPESVYLGYFRFSAILVNRIGMDHYNKSIRWFPEHGEVCHFQIEMLPLGSGTRKEKRNDRRRVVRAVAASARDFVSMSAEEYDDIAAEFHADLLSQLSNLT